MTDDRELAASLRAALAGTGDICEVTMFGGIGFMLNGNMVAAGVPPRGPLLYVGKTIRLKRWRSQGCGRW